MATEMGWVKAPCLTCVELHALCFSSVACKKTGSAEDSHGKPFSLLRTKQHLTPHHSACHFESKRMQQWGCNPRENFHLILCQSCVLPAVKSLQS